MGKLTTHILDTAAGCPAQGVKISLYSLEDGARTHVRDVVTNDDGRVDGPILEGDGFRTGVYELVFHAGAYLDQTVRDLPEPKFLDDIVIRFGISDPGQHYHVPLLLSPFGYSTYRGS